MRLDRCLPALLVLALSGCVTASGGHDPDGIGRLARTDSRDQAEDAARIHTELSQKYLERGELEAAMNKARKALEFDGNYGPAHTVMAVLDERINRPDEAEKHYRRAAELEPNKGGPNNNLAQFLCKTGQGGEALKYFKRALNDPFYKTPAVAWTNQGVCQLRLGDRAAAEQSLRKAIAIDPQDGEALLQLATALEADGDAFHASAFLQRYEALGQPTAATLALGYRIETRLGDKDAARTYRRRLQSQFPDSEQTHALDANASP